MNEIERIKEMILACDSNLRCSYYFDETHLWYSKFYFGQINNITEKVEFCRIYFDELTKRGYKTLYTEVPFNEITPDIVKEQVNCYIQNLEFTNKRIKETKVTRMIADAGKDFT